MTVGELNTRMSAREYIEWQIYLSREPLLPQRTDIQAAMMTAAFYRSQGGKARMEDFLPRYEELSDEDYPTEDELARKLKNWCAGF